MPISRKRWAGCLWPGGAHLWRYGSWPALALALAFAVLLNILLAASLVWTEWLSADVLAAGWLTAAVVWTGAAWAGWRMQETDDDADGLAEMSARDKLFCEAQTQYLQGKWVETEAALKKLLKKDRRDVEARLMLSTLWRHTERREESLSEVEFLARTEEASEWARELQQLRTKLVEWDDRATEAA